MAPGKRSSYEFEADDEVDALARAGKALLSAKGKDALLRQLKSAGESLAEASQSAEAAKLASRDLAKALARPEMLRHRDKEVRLYTALCLAHILRLNAPDTPYSDAELQSIFELLNSAYAELDDPSAPHFQLCLSILETVCQVKCSLLILDLPASEDLACSLFNTLLDALNEESAGVLEGTVGELLRSMVEEADDLPQPQLDAILSRLLPAAAAEAPAAARVVRELLRRTETVMQPYLQKLLTGLLLGRSIDSDLKEDVHSLFYALHETVPQTLLPLLPLLRDELEVEPTKQRLAAVDLLARLLTQHPGGGAIIDEYEQLFTGLLGRACDKEAEVRRRVLGYLPALLEACAGSPERTSQVVRAAVARLQDIDESVRRGATAAVAALLQAQPGLAASKNTEGRGSVLSCLMGRLRDKRLGVRKEAASQAAAVARAWVLAAEERGPAAAPRLELVLQVPVHLCGCAVRDPELGAHILDTVFRSGIFPARLAPADAARYWALMWRGAGEESRGLIKKILQGKAALQARVQELLVLRAAAKEQRAAGAGGAASSAGAGGATASGSLNAGTSLLSGGGGRGGGVAGGDAARLLQEKVLSLAAVLREVSKPEEGLQKLMEQRDNHVFRGLATLAAYGCPLKDAQTVGKDVMQRVGSKGPAADLTRALVARLSPGLLPPEVLVGAMEAAEGSQEAQRLLVDMAGAAPHLLAQSLDQVGELFEADDPLLAECGARVLAGAGRHMLMHCRQAKREVPKELTDRLAELCSDARPGCVKAAVRALVVLSGQERTAQAAADLADKLMERLKSNAARASHRALLAPLKGLSVLGRLLPTAFERVADELVDFVLDDLMAADLTRAKPLADADERTGREWRHPSAVTAIKAAALRTLCQALVPDNSRTTITEAMAERARHVWEALEPLTDTDASADQFAPFAFVFPREEGDDAQRAKRRRLEAGDEDEAAEEELELECTDAAWVRYSAVCGLLRLARAYDATMPASLYANLAITLQEPLVEPRHAMTAKLAKTVSLLAMRQTAHAGQRAAKYAACLALFAVDPEPRNRAFALRALREFVATRRRAVAALAASAAAGGGGATSLLGDMPEFGLAFLVFLLAHHPDYPTPELLEEYSQADEEEREEMFGGGGPFAPFVAMLQFALEALLVPLEGAGSGPVPAADLARLLPAPLKLLRTIKFCEDAAPQPRTEAAHQLCDLGLHLAKAIADRLRGGDKGEALEPARFPGQVVLPRMCFRANMADQSKRVDGSDLPPAAYFTPGLFENDLFMRGLMPGLPGPAGAGKRQRGPAKAKRGKARSKAAAAEEEEEADEEEDERMLDAEEESVGGTPAPGTAAGNSDAEGEEAEAAAAAAGSGGRKRKGAAGAAGRGKGRAAAAGEDSGAESAGGTAGAERDQAALAPKTKRGGSGGGKKRGSGGGARSKPAAAPSRQQPRRGAKEEAAGKLQAESSGEEDEDEDEEEDGEAGQDSQPGQQQQQQRGGGLLAAAEAAGPAGTLRAGTEDEEGWSDSEADSQPAPRQQQQQQQQQQQPRGRRQPQQQEQQQQQQQQEQPRGKRQQQQKQQPGADSPGQENRAAANGGAAGRGGGKGKAAPAAAKPAAKAKAAAAGGSKPALKRARA